MVESKPNCEEDRCGVGQCQHRKNSLDTFSQGRSRSFSAVTDIPTIKLIQHGMGVAQHTHTNREIFGCWRRPSDFLFTCVGYMIGIHNFFRFPYLCYKFGAVFFIPFILMLILLGGPMIFLEFTIGQFYSTGLKDTFTEIAPILSGISFLLTWNSMMACLLFTNLTAWMRIYSGVSTSCLKSWERCFRDHYYNTPYCFTGFDDDVCDNLENEYDADSTKQNIHPKEEYKYKPGGDRRIYFNFECVFLPEFCEAFGWELKDDVSCIDPKTKITYSYNDRRIHSATEYFYGSVCGLQRVGFSGNDRNRKLDFEKSNKEVIVQLTNWHWTKENMNLQPDTNSSTGGELFFSAATTWIVFGVFLFEEILAMGLVTYICNGIPFGVLMFVTVTALTFENSIGGLKMLMYGKGMEGLWQVDIWIEAVIQVIITTGVGNGVLISLSSFNKLNHSYIFDMIFTVFLNIATSLCSAIIVFCSLNEYINQFNIQVNFFEFIKVESSISSVEFGYICYTYFLIIITESRYTILMFFFMISSFTTDSCLRMMQVIMDALVGGLYPRLRRHPHIVLFGLCCTGLMIGMPLIKSGGVIIFMDFEYFIFYFFFPFTLLLEVTGIGWIYGTRRILDNAELMKVVHNRYIVWIFWVSLNVISPAILITVLVWNVYAFKKVHFNFREEKVLNALPYHFVLYTFASIPVILTVLGIISEISNLDNWSNWRSLLTAHEDKHIHAHHRLLSQHNLGLHLNLAINHRALMSIGDEAQLKQKEMEAQKLAMKRKKKKKNLPTVITVVEKRKAADHLTKKILQRIIFQRNDNGKLQIKKHIIEKLMFSTDHKGKLRLKKDVLRKILFRTEKNGKLLFRKNSLSSVMFTNHQGKLTIRNTDLQNLIFQKMLYGENIAKINRYLILRLKNRKRKSMKDSIVTPIVTSEEKLKKILGLITTIQGPDGPVCPVPIINSQTLMNFMQLKSSNKGKMIISKKLLCLFMLKKIETSKKDIIFMRKCILRNFMCYKQSLFLKRNQIGKLLFSKHKDKLKLNNYAIRTVILKEDSHNQLRNSELNHIKNFLVKAGADVKLWSNSSLFRQMAKSLDGQYRLSKDLIQKLRLEKDANTGYKITKHLLKKVKRRGNLNVGKHTHAKFKLAKYPFDKFNAINDAYGRLNRDKHLETISGMKLGKLITVLKFIRKLYRKKHRNSSFIKENDHRSKMDIWMEKVLKHIEEWPGRLDPPDSECSDESDYEYEYSRNKGPKQNMKRFSAMDNGTLLARLKRKKLIS